MKTRQPSSEQNKMKGHTMKKLLVTLSVIATLTFSACGKEEITTVTVPSVSTSVTETTTSVSEDKTDLSGYENTETSTSASSEASTSVEEPESKTDLSEYSETSVSQTSTVSTSTEPQEPQEKKETPEEYNTRLAEEVRELPTIAEKSQKLMEEAPLFDGQSYFSVYSQSYCYGYSKDPYTEVDKLLWPSNIYTLDELRQIIEIEKNHQDELLVEDEKKICGWLNEEFDFADYTEKDWVDSFMISCNPNHEGKVTMREYFGEGFAKLVKEYYPWITDDTTFAEWQNKALGY